MTTNFVDPTSAMESLDNYETDVQPALANGQLMQKVVAKEKSLAATSGQQCMQSLKDAAYYLETAIAASHGHPCNTSIIGLTSRYQTLVVDTDIACANYLSSSMEALKYYKYAFFFVGEGDIDEAKTLLQATADIAASLEAIAEALEQQSTTAVREAEASLEVTSKASALAHETKDKAAQARDAASALKEEREKRKTDEENAINAAKTTLDAAARARQVQDNVDMADINVLWGLCRVSREGERAKLKHLQELENAQWTEYLIVLKKQQENNQAINDLALELASLDAKGATYERAVKALEMTVTTLGGIKTCFEEVRKFWAMLKNHCHKIAGPNTILETSFMAVAQKGTGLLVKVMTDDWYRWLALAKTNYAAVLGMADVKTTVARIMSTLPNSAEASKRLPALIKGLKSKLKDSNTHLQNQIEEQTKKQTAIVAD
ncbi:hypothetical protein SPRG_13026 [Saprolegnia parasitica CBS 223.65]|uniref:Uncharacterized protein n=1 Tax=Saprolegnia parasitica (strain CBS 223.65) TaxID=695850 RepID=A0A067BTX7_SAPPC|nr:hypothetical protein SPRG_13026 [Saprolegnia parasitica CBS 223.65]KDO21688.1 hypothetical protein SPRG_13026 [Saprolegnia parasitica CBS 223.65]|eukprot:XP_012207610.1 hypothetical protein SPRG_13026 [Saprolegnia parasitica CBS 223.65]